MFLSKRKSGIYHLYYKKSNGKLTSITTKTKIKSEALKFLAGFQDPEKQQNKIAEIELKKFSLQFLKSCELQLTFKTVKAYQGTFNFFNKCYSGYFLSEISQKDVYTFLEHRKRIASLFQARKDLIALSSAFNWAIREKYLETNPCEGIKQISIPEKQPLFFSKAEFNTLLEVIDKSDIKDLVIFAVNTGLRQMELLMLQWNQIDFANCYLILDNRTHLTKSKRIRTIPLNNTALEIISRRFLHSNSDFVFTYNDKPIKQVTIVSKFKKYIIASGVNRKFNFHSLRHTFASWLVQKGVPIYTVSKLLGHSNIKTTEIYAHLQTETLRISVNVLDEPHNLTQELIR